MAVLPQGYGGREGGSGTEGGKAGCQSWSLTSLNLSILAVGLTEGEKEEGEAAKKALQEEAGERPEDADGSDDEDYKKNNQFGEHMKGKNVAVRCWNST